MATAALELIPLAQLFLLTHASSRNTGEYTTEEWHVLHQAARILHCHPQQHIEEEQEEEEKKQVEPPDCSSDDDDDDDNDSLVSFMTTVTLQETPTLTVSSDSSRSAYIPYAQLLVTVLTRRLHQLGHCPGTPHYQRTSACAQIDCVKACVLRYARFITGPFLATLQSLQARPRQPLV